MKTVWMAGGLAAVVFAAGAGWVLTHKGAAPALFADIHLPAVSGLASSGAGAVALAPTEPSYAITRYHAQFSYPDGWNVSETVVRTQTIVTAEPAGRTDVGTAGVQIAITPVGESVPAVTPERIHQDLPQLHIENPQQQTIGGVQALVFDSDNASFDHSKEAWFVRQGALYQVSAPAGSAAAFAQVVQSFRF